jgi:hypothetical protein
VVQYFDVAVYRLDNFFVWLSNKWPTAGQSLNNKTLTLCDKHNGRIEALASVLISCPPNLPAFRYVIVQVPLSSNAICLTEVQVFAGKCQNHQTFYSLFNSEMTMVQLVMN